MTWWKWRIEEGEDDDTKNGGFVYHVNTAGSPPAAVVEVKS
jgi:hypothetical protein